VRGNNAKHIQKKIEGIRKRRTNKMRGKVKWKLKNKVIDKRYQGR
jgi:hypothetical protein